MRKYVLDEIGYTTQGELGAPNRIIGHELWTKACPYGEKIAFDQIWPFCVQFEFKQTDKTKITGGCVCEHFNGFHIPNSGDFLKGVCVKCLHD